MAINYTITIDSLSGVDTRSLFPGMQVGILTAYSDTGEAGATLYPSTDGVLDYSKGVRIAVYGANFAYNSAVGGTADLYGNISSMTWKMSQSQIAHMNIIDTEGYFSEYGGIPMTSLKSLTTSSLVNAAFGQAVSFDIIGNSGNDKIFGSNAGDTLNGQGGVDLLVGMLGNDTYIVDNAGDTVVELASEGIDTVKSSINFTILENIEKLTLGGSGDIFGIGNSISNTIIGNSGDNLIDGAGGADKMKGGAGNDTYLVSSASDQITEVVGKGSDTAKTFVTYSLAATQSIETLRTTDDSGTTAINLSGNEIANKIVANNGANVVAGGGGADSLYGRGGADTFLFKTLADSTATASGRDTIQDFSRVEGDRIDLHLIDAVAGGSVNQAFKFIGSADFHDKAGELRSVASGGNTLVSGDVDGNGAADFSILLKAALTLQAGDFIL